MRKLHAPDPAKVLAENLSARASLTGLDSASLARSFGVTPTQAAAALDYELRKRRVGL